MHILSFKWHTGGYETYCAPILHSNILYEESKTFLRNIKWMACYTSSLKKGEIVITHHQTHPIQKL